MLKKYHLEKDYVFLQCFGNELTTLIELGYFEIAII